MKIGETNIVKRIASLLIGAALLTGCETIHTGVLGDIPTGMKPSAALAQGAVYHDPQGRFDLTVPDARNLVARRTPEGVVLEGKEMDRGDIGYAVLVYPVPEYVKGSDQSVLEQTFSNMKAMMTQRGADVKVVEQFQGTYKDHPAMDVYYLVRPKHSSYILYVARLVKAGNRVYNMYYYYGVMSAWMDDGNVEAEHIKKYFLPDAEKLFEGVVFKD
jgi:hypothetical protein